MPELEISPKKVAWIVVRAREYQAKAAPFDRDEETASEEFGAVLEERPHDTTRSVCGRPNSRTTSAGPRRRPVPRRR